MTHLFRCKKLLFGRATAMSTIKRMQRLLAILLLCNFGFPLLALATPTEQQSNLPACCRRGGKHHCAIQQANEHLQPSAESTARSISGKCPYSPSTGMLAAHFETLSVSFCQAVLGFVLAAPTSQSQTEALYRISFSRSRQKRGPPSLLP
jgi:hypothetical protein